MKIKTIRKNILLLLLACVTGIFINGCAGLSTVAGYQTLGTLEASSNASYQTYNQLVVSGQVKTNDLPIVAKAYNTFQVVMIQAIIQAQNNTNAPVTVDVQTAASALASTIATAQTK